MTIDDFARSDLISALGTRWVGMSDRVMGGVSRETARLDEIAGRRCLRLTGDVRLDNNGGFIQMALDLAPGGDTLDGSGFTGLRLTAWGNNETYGAHFRTPDVARPWQSYRAAFRAVPDWRVIDLPFALFEPHRIAVPLDPRRLRRLGLVAIGRAFHADLAVAAVELYR